MGKSAGRIIQGQIWLWSGKCVFCGKNRYIDGYINRWLFMRTECHSNKTIVVSNFKTEVVCPLCARC